MAEEPLPLELRLGLRAGSVFYFQSRELTSAQPHFFIVVNRDPIGTKLLLLTIVTSQIEKVRLRNQTRPGTVVEISPADYDEFKVLSAIDCNVVLEKPLSELTDMVKRKDVRYHKDLPPPILAKVKTAIQASSVVADEVKQLL
ncbi:MAG: hypothetical protein A2107_04665 [Verrucomicrobia bacterium GWF2_62_7]|nr:MAG: hypothetical protein A2107_04665 [Verrucomicrobia bacterium GWF2_62_7]